MGKLPERRLAESGIRRPMLSSPSRRGKLVLRGVEGDKGEGETVFNFVISRERGVYVNFEGAGKGWEEFRSFEGAGKRREEFRWVGVDGGRVVC